METSRLSEFTAGARTLGTGFGIILRSRRLLLLGAFPAVLSTVLLLGCLGVLIYFSGDLADWMTPFADNWARYWRQAFRLVLAIALVVAASFLGSLSFVALTLLVGGPFYEHIAEATEERLGLDSTDDGAGRMRQTGRGLRDTVTLMLLTLAGSVVLLCLGFVPVAGQLAVPVLAALFGAWIISVEMAGLVFQRGGLRLRDRHRVLRRNRTRVLGFGLPTYFLCLVPVAQLVVIPSAVVGGTLLAHRLLGPTEPGAEDLQFKA